MHSFRHGNDQDMTGACFIGLIGACGYRKKGLFGKPIFPKFFTGFAESSAHVFMK